MYLYAELTSDAPVLKDMIFQKQKNTKRLEDL